MADVAELFIKISADTTDALKSLGWLSKNLDNMGRDMKKVGGELTTGLTVPILALSGGVIALAQNTADYADRLGDLTDITGMSAKSIQEWQFVAKMAGVDTETVTGAVEGLVKRMPSLEAEGGNATKALEKMGLSFSDLKQMSPDDMMNTLITSMSNMTDPLERNAAGSALFGGEWKNMSSILGLGATEIENAKNKANELGIVMSDDALKGADNYRKGTEELMASMGGLGREIAGEFLPILTGQLIPFIQTSVIPALKDFATWVSGLITWFTGLDGTTQGIITGFILLAVSIGPIISIMGTVISVVGILAGLIAGATLAMSGQALATGASTAVMVAYNVVQGIMATMATISTVATWALNSAIAVLTSPITFVILAIVALIAIGVLLWKNWDTIVVKAGELFKGIVKWFSGIWESMKEIGSNIVKGLWSGISGGWSWLTDQVDNLVNSMVGGIKKLLKIKSPSRIFMGIGENISAGLAIGIQDAQNLAVDATVGLGQMTINAMPDATGNSSSGFNQTVIINAPTELTPQKVASAVSKTSKALALGYY